MRALRAWAVRVAGLLNPRRRGEQFDAELESHLEMHIEDNIRRGLSPEEARRHALIALGGAQVLRDSYRDRGTVPFVESLAQDVRFAFRMLRKVPGFAATAVIVLALGIGANGLLFSLINAVLVKPLNGGRLEADLIGLYSGDKVRADGWRPFSYPEFLDIRSQNDAFEHLFAEATGRVGVTENGQTRRVLVTYVSSNYFTALRVPLAAGRVFTADEERPGSDAAVAIASDRFWRQSGMPANFVGRRVTLNSQAFTIVGIAPPGVNGTMPVLATELWLPLGASRLLVGQGMNGFNVIADDRSSFGLFLSGVLKSGLSEDEADARLAPLAAAFAEAYPATNRDRQLVVHRRSRTAFGVAPRGDTEVFAGAFVLMTIAGTVLLVACLNLANMMLARGSARRQEIAVRLALGGSRLRILRQLLIEGLVLSVAGSLLALAAAWWAAERVVATVVPVMRGAVVIDVTPDRRMALSIVIACVASTLLFCLGPALKLSRPQLALAMKQAGPLPSQRRRRMSTPGILVAGQIALSLALLVAAGVFVRASLNAARSGPGFPLEGGVLAEVDPGIGGMNEAQARVVYGRLLDRLRALPEVRAASAASIVPLGLMNDARRIVADSGAAWGTYTVIGADYFASLGLPVVAGREFTLAEERQAAEPVAIVDETLARRLFGGRSALGEVIRVTFREDDPGEPLRVVGVVPSVRDDILGADYAHVYVPFGRYYFEDMTLHVRTTPGLDAAMAARLRREIEAVAPDLPVLDVRTLTAHRDQTPSLWAVILGARLLGAFGVIALLLATVGVYGLRAYLVAQRTREIGVRLAIGATRGGVIGQLVREAAGLSSVGVAIGLGLALALVQVLRQSGMLYQVSAIDPVVFTLAPLVLAAAVIVASYVPARRALRIDPAVALRPE